MDLKGGTVTQSFVSTLKIQQRLSQEEEEIVSLEPTISDQCLQNHRFMLSQIWKAFDDSFYSFRTLKIINKGIFQIY